MLLTFRHGLGDAVQLMSVIAQLRRHCPDWSIDVSLLRGKHTLFNKLADAVFLLDRGEPADLLDEVPCFVEYLEKWRYLPRPGG